MKSTDALHRTVTNTYAMWTMIPYFEGFNKSRAVAYWATATPRLSLIANNRINSLALGNAVDGGGRMNDGGHDLGEVPLRAVDDFRCLR